MQIMGVSAFYHDSAAALIRDGDIVAAAQEERFSRIKHDSAFPSRSIRYCLDAAGTDAGHLDFLVFYEKPLQKFDRLLETYVACAPRGYASFCAAMPRWLRERLHLRKMIREGTGTGYHGPLVFVAHHESHAASAFYPSPFEEAAIVTIDAVGEWATASIGVGRGNHIEILREMRFPHSAGLLYSAFTYYCGFKVNSGEYKLMGLAPYGQPRYRNLILDRLVQVNDDGSLWLDMSYFGFAAGLTMTSPKFHRLFGEAPRRPENALTQKHMDLAASVQAVLEDIMLRIARHARSLTGLRHLCLAGGVALNCVGNGRILRSGLFDDLWIQPAAGDAGGAIGAALFTWHQLLQRPRITAQGDSQRGSLLGPSFSEDAIDRFLREKGIPFHRPEDEGSLLRSVSRLLQEGKVVGWFQDRMEFGPRALGSRSILGDARRPEMQALMNLKIKYRESFRPFAPAVLEECASEYFEIDRPSPYMLLVAPVRDTHRRELTEGESAAQGDPDLRRRISVCRSTVPAITHVDYSARIQTVDQERHGRFYRLLRQFYADTGCPMLVNTSFNVRGEPIVCTPADAYRCFVHTEMDALVLGGSLLLKAEQPAQPDAAGKAAYRSAHKPD
jgi:carbamoyltransferase